MVARSAQRATERFAKVAKSNVTVVANISVPMIYAMSVWNTAEAAACIAKTVAAAVAMVKKPISAQRATEYCAQIASQSAMSAAHTIVATALAMLVMLVAVFARTATNRMNHSAKFVATVCL